MDLILTEKQELLLAAENVDAVIYGGARGGGKSFGAALSLAMEVVEWIPESEVKERGIDPFGYRNTQVDGSIFYFKYLIDYPEYEGLFVRRTEEALMNQTHSECRKIYPLFGGKWSNKQWTFPSGASITYRPCNRPEHLDWFQGQNKHRVCIEELTQFDKEEVEEIEACCRSAHAIIKAKKIYTCNPGKRGHLWVYKKFIKTCPPVNDGEPIYLPEHDLTYQPLAPGGVYTNEFGERHIFIPALVFDNPYLSERDKNYVRNLKSKNEILKQMWLFGNWNVFAGQFFEMWRESVHIKDELEFFGAADYGELVEKRKTFDWSRWQLFMSNDYGFAATSAWACLIFAVNCDTGDAVCLGEIVKSGLTIKQQARETKEFLMNRWGLTVDDLDLCIADPKSYWQRQDKGGDEFWTFALAYQEEGILLTKGLNDREQGAMAVAEALMPREDGTARLTFLNCCAETCESIPNLPADPKNPNDVDSKAFDHPYDALRYFLMVLIGSGVMEKERIQENPFDWRKRVREYQKNTLGTYEGEPKSWLVA